MAKRRQLGDRLGDAGAGIDQHPGQPLDLAIDQHQRPLFREGQNGGVGQAA